MRNQLFALALAVAFTVTSAAAQAEEDLDDIVRLPGQGQVKSGPGAPKGKPERLVCDN